MSGNDISNLSYKELQALALRYRVPGNIKKQLLIEVLQAARCGNKEQVDKLLSDLRQTRKKRIRKGKPTKLSLSSTPIHSPTYDMADDYYTAQNRLPYQWVGAEEEIPNRQDETNRIPQYEEFRQFLLRRIQRDYQTYNTNNNEKVDLGNSGGLIDLRNEPDSIRFDTDQIGIRSNVVPINSLQETAHSYSEQIQTHNNAAFDYQILEDSNGNGHASILLRRMLQAPVGADLGEIASPELGSNCRIWTGGYQSQNNLLDNSDTLSANSDVNENDDNNWPDGSEYYRFVNNIRDQLILNPANVPVNRTLYDQSGAGQFANVITSEENPVEYQFLYTNETSEVLQNCQQQWENTAAVAAASFDNNQASFVYQNLKNYGVKTFPASGTVYFDENGATNYTITRATETDNLQQQYPGEDASSAIYSGNQNVLANDVCNNNNIPPPSRTEMKLYHNLNNNNSARQVDEMNNYTFVRPPLIAVNYDAPAEVQQQNAGTFIPPMQHLSFSSPQQTATQSSQIEEFDRTGIFGQYHHNMLHKVNTPVESQQFYQQPGDRLAIIPRPDVEGKMEGDVHNRNKSGRTSTTVQSDSGVSLEPFWPQRSAARNTPNNYLENILNLNAYGYIDYSKIDQTSCIYCYAAPIVTQRLFSGNTNSCSQKRRFVAEFRQHTFSPYWLLYSDSNTGMQMSKHVKVIDRASDSVERRSSEGIESDPSDQKSLVDSEHKTLQRNESFIDMDINNSESTQPPPIINDSLFHSNEQLTTELVTKQSHTDDQFHAGEIPPTDPKIIQLTTRPETGTGSNDQDETQSVFNNLHTENMIQTEELNRAEKCGAEIIEIPGNVSTSY